MILFFAAASWLFPHCPRHARLSRPIPCQLSSQVLPFSLRFAVALASATRAARWSAPLSTNEPRPKDHGIGAAEKPPVLEDTAPRQQVPNDWGRCLRTRAPKLFGEAEATPKTSHTQDTLLATLEPQVLRIALMMMKTVEGVRSSEKGEGVEMDEKLT